MFTHISLNMLLIGVFIYVYTIVILAFIVRSFVSESSLNIRGKSEETVEYVKKLLGTFPAEIDEEDDVDEDDSNVEDNARALDQAVIAAVVAASLAKYKNNMNRNVAAAKNDKDQNVEVTEYDEVDDDVEVKNDELDDVAAAENGELDDDDDDDDDVAAENGELDDDDDDAAENDDDAAENVDDVAAENDNNVMAVYNFDYVVTEVDDDENVEAGDSPTSPNPLLETIDVFRGTEASSVSVTTMAELEGGDSIPNASADEFEFEELVSQMSELFDKYEKKKRLETLEDVEDIEQKPSVSELTMADHDDEPEEQPLEKIEPPQIPPSGTASEVVNGVLFQYPIYS